MHDHEVHLKRRTPTERDAYLQGFAAAADLCSAKAREYASLYPQSSDGRNTFLLLAEWIDARAVALKE